MAVPTVLLYNLENEKGRKIKLLCLTQKLRARAVSPAEYGETVGALAGFGERTGAPYTGPGFSEEMLVMAGSPAGSWTPSSGASARRPGAPWP